MEHYTTLKHWLRAKWRNMPDEQTQMMLFAANALESAELEIQNLRRELNQCRSLAASQNANVNQTPKGND